MREVISLNGEAPQTRAVASFLTPLFDNNQHADHGRVQLAKLAAKLLIPAGR